jgi:uncharacterized protein YbjT (DUF2867 family)
MFVRSRRILAAAVFLMASVWAVCGVAQEGVADEAALKTDGELILVAGATGRTGKLVVSELLSNGYRVRAFVRNADEAREKIDADIDFAVGDVRERESIDSSLDGVSAIICAIGAGRGDPSNGPEFVDYGGVKNLVEAAGDAELRQFVLMSSGGVTHEDHVLNKMFDNVLIWKFKGEEAVRNSGVPYTIVRPGGLIDKPSDPSAVILQQGDSGEGMIPRADVAVVLVRSLQYREALGKTFEVTSGDMEARLNMLKAD